MGHPGSVVTSFYFTQFILPNFFECAFIGFRVIPDRNLGGHATHGVDATSMTGLDQQVHVRTEEVALHRDFSPVGQNEFGLVAELLDEAEDVIPSTTIQARRMIA